MRALGGAIAVTASIVMLGAACTSLDGLAGTAPAAPDGGDGSTPADAAPSGDTGADAQPQGSIDEACTKGAEVFCNRLATCDPAAVQLLFGGPSTCAVQAKLLCTTEATAPGARVTPAEITACSEASAAQTCAERLDGKKPPACNHVGDRPEGASCIGDAQCATGYCAGLGSGCGTCRPAAKAGQPCGTGCARGLRCLDTANDPVCSEPLGADELCIDSSQCSRALQCVSRQCVPWLEENTPCSPLPDMKERGCDPAKSLACSAVLQACVKAPVVQPGAECAAKDGISPVCSGGRCEPEVAGASRCTRWAALGEPCTDRPCIQPLWCVAGECVVAAQTLCPN